MAIAEQLKSLIRSHFSDEPERFYTIALQIAAYEAQQGHGALAHEIREIIDNARQERKAIAQKLPQDMRGLVLLEKPEVPKTAMVIPKVLNVRIERIIHEYRQRHVLKVHSLTHRRKILLIGPSGTGKTMTARILAYELSLPMYTIQVDRLVTKFMGETSAKLRLIFDMIQREIGIYLFDEFDAIGGERSLENDVGEMRRVLNAFLQFIEQDNSDSLIIAASNSPKLLDRALFRRFDDVLYYKLPKPGERQQLMRNILGQFLDSEISWKQISTISNCLSQAEIDQACRDAIKQAILNDKKSVEGGLLKLMLGERQNARSGRIK